MPEVGSPRISLAIQGSSLSTVNGNINLNLIATAPVRDSTLSANYDEVAEGILMQEVAFGALFNSEERYDPPKCHPDTRVAVRNNIDQWAKRPPTDRSSPLLWLKGAAGAGKSAIAQTLTEEWDKDQTLAASFVFFRTASGRNNKIHFIPTILYQLIRSFPSIKAKVLKVIRDDMGVFKKDLRTQMTNLIIGPLSQVTTTSGSSTVKIVVIDGLDECCVDLPSQDHEQQQKEILDAIELALATPGLPVRFLVASRPERQIRESLCDGHLATRCHCIHLVQNAESDADIELFLRCSFDSIKQKWSSIDAHWPSNETIFALVKKSSGHFVYAAVVARYLSNPRLHPESSLRIIMGLQPADGLQDHPFATLDALYTHIMSSIAPQSVGVVSRVLELLVQQFTVAFNMILGTPFRTPASIEEFLFLEKGSIYLHLVDMHSVLDVPAVGKITDTKSGSRSISFIHASFGEFLEDPSRSGQLIQQRESVVPRFLNQCMQHVLILYGSIEPPPFYYRENFSRKQHILGAVVNFLNHRKWETFRDSQEFILALETARRHRVLYVAWHYYVTEVASSKAAGTIYEALENTKNYYHPDDHISILRYLKKCNTTELEPSAIRRQSKNIGLQAEILYLQGRKAYYKLTCR